MRLLVLILLLAQFASAQKWIKVRSPNFEVRTDAGDRRGREVAMRFEQMRKVFQVLLPRPMKPTQPLIVVAFRDQNGLMPVASQWKGKPIEVGGLFFKGEDRNYIALNASAENRWQLVFHEYAHSLMSTNFPPAPAWWDEGFADYYSTVSFTKTDFVVGEPPEGYIDLLRQGLMPSEKLLTTARESEEYNQPAHQRTLFYAQSWLFVHYLFDKRLLEAATQYFNLTMNLREPPSSAVQRAFGKTMKELDDALKQYVAESGWQKVRFPVADAIATPTYVTRKLEDIEVRTTIAELYLASPDHQADAEREFRSILQSAPNNATAHRGLGYVLMRKSEFEDARKEFSEAVELGLRDTKVYFYAAYCLQKQGRELTSNDLVWMGRMLDQALALDPDDAEALNLKATVVGRASNNAEAVRLLRRAVELQPRKPEFKLNLAYQLMLQRKFDEADGLLQALMKNSDPAIAAAARKHFETSKIWRASPLQQQLATSRDKYTSEQWGRSEDVVDKDAEKLEAAQRGEETEERPVKFAKGILISSQCSGSGELLAKARIGKKPVTLHAPDYAKLVTVGAEVFNCGWKNRPMTLNYRERGAADFDIVSIEVR
jgi:Flp pilus assembly protein TadD